MVVGSKNFIYHLLNYTFREVNSHDPKAFSVKSVFSTLWSATHFLMASSLTSCLCSFGALFYTFQHLFIISLSGSKMVTHVQNFASLSVLWMSINVPRFTWMVNWSGKWLAFVKILLAELGKDQTRGRLLLGLQSIPCTSARWGELETWYHGHAAFGSFFQQTLEILWPLITAHLTTLNNKSLKSRKPFLTNWISCLLFSVSETLIL